MTSRLLPEPGHGSAKRQPAMQCGTARRVWPSQTTNRGLALALIVAKKWECSKWFLLRLQAAMDAEKAADLAPSWPKPLFRWAQV